MCRSSTPISHRPPLPRSPFPNPLLIISTIVFASCTWYMLPLEYFASSAADDEAPWHGPGRFSLRSGESPQSQRSSSTRIISKGREPSALLLIAGHPQPYAGAQMQMQSAGTGVAIVVFSFSLSFRTILLLLWTLRVRAGLYVHEGSYVSWLFEGPRLYFPSRN